MPIQPLNILLTIPRPASPMAPDRWENLQLPNTRFHIRNFVFGIFGARVSVSILITYYMYVVGCV